MAWSPQARKAAALARKRRSRGRKLTKKQYIKRGAAVGAAVGFQQGRKRRIGAVKGTIGGAAIGAASGAAAYRKANKKLKKKSVKRVAKPKPKRGIGRDGKTRLTKAQLKNRKLKTHAKYGYGPNGKKLSKAQMRKKKRR